MTILTAPFCSNNLEFSAKASQDKKKNCRQYNKQYQKSSIPATKINAAKLDKANKRKSDNKNWNYLGKISHNPKKSTCYNCNKKGHDEKFFSKFLKN